MEQLLQQYGFRFTDKCYCDGHTTHKYKLGEFALHWRTGKYQFKIKKRGMTVIGWSPVNYAAEILATQIKELSA